MILPPYLACTLFLCDNTLVEVTQEAGFQLKVGSRHKAGFGERKQYNHNSHRQKCHMYFEENPQRNHCDYRNDYQFHSVQYNQRKMEGVLLQPQ